MMRRLTCVVLVLCLGYVWMGCDDAAPTEPEVEAPVFEQAGEIGASGGTVQITDENSPIHGAYVEVPQDALPSGRRISINPVTEERYFNGDSTALFVSFEPDGIEFEAPVEIGVPYNQEEDPNNLKVYYFNDDEMSYEAMPTVRVDTENRVVVARTLHFSEFTTQNSEEEIKLDVSLYEHNGKLAVAFKLPVSLNQIPTSIPTSLRYGVGNFHQLLEQEGDAFAAVYGIELYERTGSFLGVDRIAYIETKSIGYEVIDASQLNRLRAVARAEDGSVFFGSPSSGEGPDRIEAMFSGEPVLAIFDHTPDQEKEYYVNVDLYLIDADACCLIDVPGLFGYHAYSGGTDILRLSDLNPVTFDQDGDAIIDSWDRDTGGGDNQPPAAPSNPSPSDNATNVSTSTTLSWSASDPDGDALTYDVYFGTSSNPSRVHSGQSSTSYDPGTLAESTTYYWKIVAEDTQGHSTQGPLWQFTTASGSGGDPGDADYTNSIGMEFMRIEAGTFRMGDISGDGTSDERPVHEVTISQDFYLGRYEVTQAQWEEVMGSNPSSFYGCQDCPVERVSWNDVQDFIATLNVQEGTTRYRLPTEAEWEYAARAGTETKWSFGNDEGQLGEYAWYRDNSDPGTGRRTHPVGQKYPNPWGLYDVHGNVFEWVQDWYDRDYYPSSPILDPQGPSGGTSRVRRGGDFTDVGTTRSASRSFRFPTHGLGSGFRLLRQVQ